VVLVLVAGRKARPLMLPKLREENGLSSMNKGSLAAHSICDSTRLDRFGTLGISSGY
jgi:hypothetical protein